jgi:hypothetical protein
MERTPQAVAQWLQSLGQLRGRIKWARPVEVTIGKITYQGAMYAEEETRAPQERAVTEGHAKPGDKWPTYAFMLLGLRPKHKREHNAYTWNHNLPMDDHGRSIGEWYVSSYYESNETNEYHPFGANFQIREWIVATYGYYKDWKIDTNERYTYDRIPMSVKFLDE